MTDPRDVRSWGNRRDFLKTSAAMAAGAYGLSWLPARAAEEIPLEYDGSKFQLKAPEPNPKSGGVLRIGVTMRPPHFDIHQSGTINTLAAMTVMFDNLIRRDPRDGQTIIPDLAESWEIAKDGKTYTFHLRKGVEFHDGAELTSEDVKATFDRIRKPPKGVSIPRSVLFRAVDEIAVPDKYTVQFKLAEPRPVDFIMAAIASGWNVIVRKKTLEDNNYDLKKVQGLSRYRSVPPRQVRRDRKLGDDKKQELLEQGAAVSRRRHVLPRAAVFDRARLGCAVGPGRLYPHHRPGNLAQGQGNAGHVGSPI